MGTVAKLMTLSLAHVVNQKRRRSEEAGNEEAQATTFCDSHHRCLNPTMIPEPSQSHWAKA
jgi:hypothetical protein